MKNFEDYEEPKEYWHINTIGAVGLHTRTNGMTDSENSYIEDCQLEIGNYFETKEEAEKAVEKLKAFKRLKDRKFGFYGYQFHDILSGVLNIKAEFENDSDNQIVEDLDICFGGEE